MDKRSRQGTQEPARGATGAGGAVGVEGEGPRGQGWKRWLPMVAIFLLAMAVHWPGSRAAYLWDDQEYLTANKAVQRWDGFWELWVPGNTTLYVPLVTSTLWLEHKVYGLGSVGADGLAHGVGYHVDNMLLHAASAVLL